MINWPWFQMKTSLFKKNMRLTRLHMCMLILIVKWVFNHNPLAIDFLPADESLGAYPSEAVIQPSASGPSRPFCVRPFSFLGLHIAPEDVVPMEVHFHRDTFHNDCRIPTAPSSCRCWLRLRQLSAFPLRSFSYNSLIYVRIDISYQNL